jgi:predicted deacylase
MVGWLASPKFAEEHEGKRRRVGWLVALVLAIPSIAFAQAPFTVGTITAAPGTVASGELKVAAAGGDAGTIIPISIVNGARPGPVLVLAAGVHGAEYPPILALQRLRASLDPKAIAGTVVMVHVANMPSFLKRTIYYSPADGKNLNRVFPGRADGTLSERIAYVLSRDVLERASAVVDLHCGDANESLRPYSYWETVGAPAVQEEGRNLALAFGLDHIVIDSSRPTDPAASVYLANTAITRGKPGVTIESGALGMSDEESIARIERGVAGVMKYLKMQPTGPDPIAHPVYLGKSQVLTSPATGIFYWTVERGQTVAEGTLVGYVTDFFGKRIAEIRAPFAGEVLYVVGTPAMNQGEPVGFIGERTTGSR